ncbi:hypothetical protein [Streptomyces sp. NPDC056817]|uniref:hypothetical protein n=1 Tax=Streptomyces sp. NPDC056817 TaxID=3345950 RepID=UPI0036B68ADF
MTSEPRPAAASRTAPRVDANRDSVAFTFGESSRLPIGTGPVLAVLLDQAAAGEAGRMPHGSPHLTAAPITEHAHRHRDQVRRFLTTANTPKDK